MVLTRRRDARYHDVNPVWYQHINLVDQSMKYTDSPLSELAKDQIAWVWCSRQSRRNKHTHNHTPFQPNENSIAHDKRKEVDKPPLLIITVAIHMTFKSSTSDYAPATNTLDG